MQTLAAGCAQPLPPRAVEAIRLFNAGEYYRQHDLLEELWRETEEPIRDLYRAVLQVGIAYYQVLRGNRRGALKMLRRSLRWLDALPDVCQGVDVADLREGVRHLREVLMSTPPGADITALDRSLFRPVRLISEGG